ncbi:hypothetical protein [Candidatus Endomicrobiellum devescovinae]|jgi:hypothetical protein|uniref:hypothetical protein n=1 Tax=Candidatus Endomicrobiellum devescovinae TaxID=3242322 RepID=UPI002837A1C8|nr:hypothetical protein [Endomicrobium sp.]
MAQTLPYNYNERIVPETSGWGWRDTARSHLNRGKTKGLDAFNRMIGMARGGGFSGTGEADSPFAMQPSKRERLSNAYGRVRNIAKSEGTASLARGKEFLGNTRRKGLDAFSSGWNKAKGLFERPEDEPEEDLTTLSEQSLEMKKEKDTEIRYQIEKIKKKYDSMIKYEKDPLERRSLEIERDMKIRKASGKKGSAAEEFMMGKGNDVLSAMNSTTDADVIPAGYKSYDVDSNPDEIARARTYNKKLGEMHNRWGKPAATVGKGLGAFAAASMGGIPGLVAGTALSKGIPMAADWLMNRNAQKHEDQDADERRYNPNRL